MSKSILIRNVTAILPTGRAETNVLIQDGVILSVDAARNSTADEVVDGAGLVLFPGLIDDQVHFRGPGLTHKEDLLTASQACAAGGVTSFLEMPNTKPSAINQSLVEDKFRLAASKSIVNFGFYIGATAGNLETLKHATGVSGIKIFIGSSTGDLLVDDQNALERIFAETTLPICAHCEDETTDRQNQAPARVWSIVGKGRIAVGYDADLVLVDPNETRQIENAKQFTKSNWSPWAGETLRGWPTRVFVAGRTDYQSGKIMTQQPGSCLQFDHALGGFWKTHDGVGPRQKMSTQ